AAAEDGVDEFPVGQRRRGRERVLRVLEGLILAKDFHVPQHRAIAPREGDDATRLPLVHRAGEEDALAPHDWRGPALPADGGLPDLVLGRARSRRQALLCRQSLSGRTPEPRPFFATGVQGKCAPNGYRTPPLRHRLSP